jgi:hypothetical protein
MVLIYDAHAIGFMQLCKCPTVRPEPELILHFKSLLLVMLLVISACEIINPGFLLMLIVFVSGSDSTESFVIYWCYLPIK